MFVLELSTFLTMFYLAIKIHKIDKNTELYVRFEANPPPHENKENNPKSTGTSDSWIAADNCSH